MRVDINEIDLRPDEPSTLSPMGNQDLETFDEDANLLTKP